MQCLPLALYEGNEDGRTLVFPHHENETAQASCCWYEPLANYWMHAGMLRVEGEKMSKSLGNFYSLKEVLVSSSFPVGSSSAS